MIECLRDSKAYNPPDRKKGGAIDYVKTADDPASRSLLSTSLKRKSEHQIPLRPLHQSSAKFREQCWQETCYSFDGRRDVEIFHR